ncbi:hypothetical protein FOL47_000729 [Perkinsus chesapeaki]|uniref:Uncharacterized protein n=1 Tax=Perkinsus chesapeaki TaxID=330153 RepID=A0A7J6MLC5_PERCH|nr:hypothetical protein FOL47_000729 [Perkinsus chesapeaki]
MSRLRVVLSVVNEVLGKGHFSRREMFKLTGNLGFDPLLQQPVERAIADAIRSTTGAVGASWDDMVSLDNNQFEPLQELLKWTRELCMTLEECKHYSILNGVSNGNPIVLYVATDASLVGGGFVMKVAADCVAGVSQNLVNLRQECLRWSKTQQNWHSNRRELYVILKALQAVSDLVASCKSVCIRKCIVFKVYLACDNKPSVNWLVRSTAGAVSRSKAWERRALSRVGLAD